MQRPSQRRKYSPAAYKPYKMPRRTRARYPGRSTYNRAGVVAGYTRRTGYYGRFSGPGGEKKFKDTIVNDAVVAQLMTFNQITVIAEGASESQRIGRKITVKSVHIKGTLKLANTGVVAETVDHVKLFLVQDTQTNGSLMTAVQLLETDNYASFRNLANSGRFKILYSKSFNLVSKSGAGDTANVIFGEDIRTINCNVRCNIPIEYDNSAATGVVTSVRSNNLYWVSQSKSGFCEIHGNARVRYEDR